MPLNKVLCVCLFALLFCLCGIERAACQSAKAVPLASIPFEYDPILNPYITLSVSIDGKPPLFFIFDTGCGVPIVFSHWGAEQTKVPRHIVYLDIEEAGELQTTSVKTLTFLSAQQKPFTIKADKMIAGIYEEKHSLDRWGKKIAGLLGWQAFSNYGVELDFAAKQLRLYPAKAKPAAFKAIAPLSLKEHGLLMPTPAVQAGISSKYSHSVTIDTGYNVTMIPSLPPNYNKMLAAKLSYGGFVGQETYEMVTYLVPEFFIGDQRIALCEVGISERGDANVIGLDMLRCFRVFFDFPGKKLYLKPINANPQYPLYGRYDVVIKQKADKVLVDYIRKGSAPERAGLKSGDTLLSVDGVAMTKHPLNLTQGILNGFAGTTATLKIERENGSVERLSYRREQMYLSETGTQPRMGFQPAKDVDGKPYITGMEQGSLALKVGVRPGDRLVALNGTPFTQENDAILREISRKSDDSELKLEVLRKGKPLVFVIPPRPKP